MPGTEPNDVVDPSLPRRLRRAKKGSRPEPAPDKPGWQPPSAPRGPAPDGRGNQPFNRSSRHRGSGKR